MATEVPTGPLAGVRLLIDGPRPKAWAIFARQKRTTATTRIIALAIICSSSGALPASKNGAVWLFWLLSCWLHEGNCEIAFVLPMREVLSQYECEIAGDSRRRCRTARAKARGDL